jgi:hypothetical protein
VPGVRSQVPGGRGRGLGRGPDARPALDAGAEAGHTALSPLGERVARAGAFFSRHGTREGVDESHRLPFLIKEGGKRK